MSKLFKTSLLLTVFFGFDKLVGLVRQTLIARQFGFGSEIDAFNVANNLPDLVFSLFSGGAIALAFIPIFTAHIADVGKVLSWRLFSKTANILFLITLIISAIFYLLARPLVTSQFGISPGFSPGQQDLVIDLMRLNLIALLIFSISGLMMASLQSHKHFFLPALAPILYNLGLIIGVLILAPTTGLQLGAYTLPALGLGIYGLTYGTVLGALMHLLIQIPGVIHHQFRWTAILDFKDETLRRLFRLLGPRIGTVLLINIIFIARDNLASRMPEGSVTALTYGYFIAQVPETLIGTAIATALLPTLSELITKKQHLEFAKTINLALKVIISFGLITGLVLSILLPELIDLVFNFKPQEVQLLTSVTRGFLLGLLAHSVLEVIARAFYARQNAKLPLLVTFLRTAIFLGLAAALFDFQGVTGLAIADSIAVSVEVIILVLILYKDFPQILNLKSTLLRAVLGSLVSLIPIFLLINYFSLPALLSLLLSLTLPALIYLFFIKEELKLLLKL